MCLIHHTDYRGWSISCGGHTHVFYRCPSQAVRQTDVTSCVQHLEVLVHNKLALESLYHLDLESNQVPADDGTNMQPVI